MSDYICEEVLIALRRIIQSIDLHSRYLVRQFGLTGPQLIILQELSRLGEVSVGDLSKAISLSQATVTGILERLEKTGLVVRRRSEIDRRRVMVQATPACRDILKKAPPPMQESFTLQFKNLKDWEQTMILSSLQHLVCLMDAKNLDAAPFLATGPINESSESNIRR